MLTVNKDTSVTSNGEDFFIWKKEICSIAIEDDNGTEIFGKFQRLEFYELCDQDLVIDWLEPVIHNDRPALVLHCSKDEKTRKTLVDRISKTEYYLSIAEAVAKRSTCLRRQYGAIIVKNDEILSTGYNGSPRGTNNCCDIGKCWREENNIPHGEQYEACLAVHAEQNAIISASRRDMIGATLYLVGFENSKRIPSEQVKPCKICEKMIINSGIIEVVA